MAVITENGIELRTLEQIVSDNSVLWSEKTGDFDVAPSSAGGELIAIKSEVEARVDQDIANAFINTTIQASGANLDLVAERKGVYRRTNIPTVAIISITGDNGTTITQGTQFTSSANDEIFTTQYQAVIADGVALVSVQSVNFDSIICPALSLSLVTPIAGVTTATNTASGIIGYVVESDASLRQRIGLVGTELTHIKDGLFFALTSLAGVAKARVVDNNTDAVMYGLVPARYFAPVVYGGNEEEVARTIYQFTQNGNPSYGDIQSVTPSLRGQNYIIEFTRASEVSVAITISYTADSTFDIFSGEGQIIQNVIDYVDNLGIGETLFIQRLEALCFINGVTSVDILLDADVLDIVPDFYQIIITNNLLVSIV
jgi:uncharacterized phage protein gp47/JayE